MKDNVKLGTLGDIFIGLTYRPDDVSNEGTVVLRSSNIQNGRLDFADTVRVKCKVRENLIVKPNDILMCSRNGSAKLVGKCTLLPKLDEEMTFGAFMTIIRTQHNPYLLHFFNSNAFRNQLGSAATTTINQITRKMLDDIVVPIYAKAQEDYIVSVFNQIDALIYLRQQQLEQLDELVKSRFTEMFGDPMTNPMGWDKVNISTVVGGKVSNGFFAKRDDYCDDGNVEVLGVANIVNRMYSNIENLPQTNGTDADIEKYVVKYGDMLFCRSSLVAAGIGKASIVPRGTPNNVLFECHVIRLPLDLNKCVPEFMQVLSTTDYFRNQVIAQSKTATMTTIGQDGILKTDIILPPLELQKQFLEFVEQTEKSKLAVQQSIAELEELKKSLMQQYFG